MTKIEFGAMRPFVEQLIAEGRFADESEAVQAALATFQGVDSLIAANDSEIRASIEQGISELDRGRGRPFDPDEIRKIGEDLRSNRMRR